MRNRLLAALFVLSFFYARGQIQQPAENQIYLKELSNWNGSHLRNQGGIQAYSDLWGYAANGHEYAIIGALDSFYFIEVTDPRHPVVRSRQAGRYKMCFHREFKTYKHYCYAIGDEGNSSLQIFDMQYLPDSVHKVYDSDTLSQDSHTLWIDTAKSRLYLNADFIQYSHTYPEDVFLPMLVLSLENPEVPVSLGPPSSFWLTQDIAYVHDCHVRGDTAYLACADQGLYIFNFKSPQIPLFVNSLQVYTQRGYNHSNWITADGKTLVFTDETPGTEVKVCDISDIQNPKTLSPLFYPPEAYFGQDYQYGSTPHNPYIIGNNLLYMSYYQDGVLVYDISNPKSPQKIAQFKTYPHADSIPLSKRYKGFMGCWGVYPFLPSGNIIAADMANGLFVLRLDTIINTTDANNNLLGQDSLTLAGVEKINNSVLPIISIYPNPASGTIHVNISTVSANNFDFELSDASGKKIWQDNKQILAGKSSFGISLPNSQLTPGMYFLKIQSGGKFETVKVLAE